MIGWPKLETSPVWRIKQREPIWPRIRRSIGYVLFVAAMFYLFITWSMVLSEPVHHIELPKLAPSASFDERNPQGWAEFGNMYMGRNP